jgi:Raf kinase inhibitor-like YbhB/YbcL family protein
MRSWYDLARIGRRMRARFPTRRSSAQFARYAAPALCWACLSACPGGEHAAQPNPAPTTPSQPTRSADAAGEPARAVSTQGPADVAGSAGTQAGSSAALAVAAPAAVGGSVAVPAAANAGTGGMSLATTQAGTRAAAGQPSPGTAQLTLTPTDAKALPDGAFAFPASALPPMNQSPAYAWTGVPAEAKSLALVFRDVSSATPPVKWILWDIPPTTTQVPANMGSSPHPTQIPGSSQLGSLSNQGYAGPCCSDHEYEWILYALDVATLPNTERASTAQIRMDLLLKHDVAQSKPVMMRIMP